MYSTSTCARTASSFTQQARKSRTTQFISSFTFALAFLCAVQSSWGQTFKNKSEQTVAGSTITVPKPVNLAVGDLMIAQISRSSDNNVNMTNATGSDWSVVSGNQYRSNNDDRWHVTVLQKFATAADVSSNAGFSFTGNETDNMIGAIMAFSEACRVSVVGNWGSTTNDNSYSAPQITTLTPNSMIVMFGAVANDGRLATNNSWSFGGASMIERYDIEYNAVSDMGMAAATLSLNALTTGSGSAILSDNVRNTSLLIAISGNPTVSASVNSSSICAGSSANLTSSALFNNPTTATIAFQGFETGDSWGYTQSTSGVSTSTSVVRTGLNSLRLTGSDNNNVDPEVTFNNIQLAGYSNIQLSVAFAAQDVDSQDDLFLDVSYDNGGSWTSIKLVDGFDQFNSSFNQVLTTNTTSGVVVSTNPYILNISNNETQITVRIKFDERSNRDNSEDYYYIDDVTLTGTPISENYSWTSNPAGFTSSLQTPTVTPTTTTTYTVTATNAYGCSASANTTVTVNSPTVATTPTINDYVWRGSSSSDYATVANWLQHNGTSLVAATVAPTTSNNVIIPAAQTCVLNQPSLGSNTVNARNITIESGASIDMGSGTLNVGGDFSNYGTFIPGTSTVKMVGTATQDFIYGVGASHVFYNLTINKAAGDEVVLNSHIDVTNELRITNKNFRLNSLNIDLGTTGMIMDEGPGHRIYCDCPVGFVQRTINIPANTTVDPGNLGLTITTNANAMGNTVIKRRHQRAGSNGASELVTGTPGVYRIFDVTPQFNGGTTYPLASGGLDVDLEFQYYIDEVGSDILAQEGEFGLWRSGDAGATWEPKYGTVNTTTKTITLEGWQQFSWVTGGPVENPSALPIELVSFQANCKDDNSVSVTWVTASEHNTSHYVVEKSRDGINWSMLGQTAAAGNSTELLTYEMIDSEKASGTTYYRLTQFDNDGVYEVFDPVSVNCNGTTSNNHIMTYPNPSSESFYVSLFTETMEGNGQLTITDASGRPVYQTSVNIQDGNNVFHIGDLNAAPGMYYIQVSNGTTTTDIVKHSLR